MVDPRPHFFHGRGNKRCHLLGTRKRKKKKKKKKKDLHSTLLDVSALINPTATPRCSFDNLAISCFPNVWILTMYTFDNMRFILRLSTIFSCKRSISSVRALLTRINSRLIWPRDFSQKLANSQYAIVIVRVKQLY